jgi:hypothetical protein
LKELDASDTRVRFSSTQRAMAKLWVLFDEPAAYSECQPRFAVNQELVGFNRCGSVWLSSNEILVRDWTGNVLQRVSLNLPERFRCPYWELLRTHLSHPEGRFALLVGRDDAIVAGVLPSSTRYLFRLNLETLELRLGPDLRNGRFNGFSPDARFYCWSYGTAYCFRSRFDLGELSFDRIPDNCITLDSIPIIVSDSGDLLYVQFGVTKAWRSTGEVEEISEGAMLQELKRRTPDLELRMIVQIESGHVDWMRPIVLASHSLRLRCLAVLANCSPQQKPILLEALPDQDTKSLFDGFHDWHCARRGKNCEPSPDALFGNL